MNPKPKHSQMTTIAIILAAAFIVAFVGYHYLLRRTVQMRIQEVRDEGYPATLAELEKWYPQIQAESNAAPIYEKAFAALDFKYPTMISTGLPLSDTERQEIGTYLKRNETALRLLHEAAAYPDCRFMQLMNDQVSIKLLTNFRKSTLLLGCETVFFADQKNNAAALSSIESMAALIRALHGQPCPGIITYFVRVGCVNVFSGELNRLLGGSSLTDEQLGRLSVCLESLEDNKDALFQALVSERCFYVFVVTTGILPIGETKMWERAAGLPEWDFLLCMKAIRRAIPVSRRPFPGCMAELQAISRSGDGLPRFMTNTHNNIETYGSVADLGAKALARIRAMRTAVDVELARGAGGEAPEIFDTKLIDPFNGKPLIYKRLAKGYVVYSVGANLVDDGGDGVKDKDVCFTVMR